MGMRMVARAISLIICLAVMLGGASVFSVIVSGQAPPQLYPIELACAESSKAVNPGETCTYTITVSNTGTVPLVQDSSVSLSAAMSAESGWSAAISPDKVDVGAGESVDAVLTVTAPKDALAGAELTVTVTGTSTGTVPAGSGEGTVNVTAVVNAVHSFEVQAPSGKEGKRNDTLSYVFVVKNLGNVNEVFSVSASTKDGWIVNCPASIAVPAYSSKDVVVSLVVPANAAEGAQPITLDVSLADPAIKKSASTYASISIEQAQLTAPPPIIWNIILSWLPWILLALLALLLLLFLAARKKNVNVRLICDHFHKDVVPGGGAVYKVRVENTGAGNADVDVSINKIPRGWQASLDYCKFHLKGGESKDFILTVKANDTAHVGEEAPITLVGKIAGTSKCSVTTRTKVVERTAQRVAVSGIINEPIKPQPKDGVHTSVMVKNADMSDRSAMVKFYVNDELRGTKRVSVPAGGTAPAKFFWICQYVENKLTALADNG